MKTITANLATHLAGEVVTLATCWKVTRADGAVFRFTDHVFDIVFSAETYIAGTGFNASAVASSADFSVDNLDIEGILDDSTVRDEDLHAGLWDFATVEIFRVNYNAPADGALKQRKGRLGEVRLTPRRAYFVAELRGLTQALQQTIGEVYLASCSADLGDARCAPTGLIGGVTLASLTATGQSVTAVTDRRTFSASGLANGAWTGGKVTFTSGANAGYSMEVKAWDNGTKTLTLVLQLPFAIAVADLFSVQPGCLKRFTQDCRDTYNNAVNYRGFPYVPGTMKILRGAR